MLGGWPGLTPGHGERLCVPVSLGSFYGRCCSDQLSLTGASLVHHGPHIKTGIPRQASANYFFFYSLLVKERNVQIKYRERKMDGF